MAKKEKQPKKISPYEEMNLPAREVEETLPSEFIQPPESPEGKQRRIIPTKDYLDDFTPHQDVSRKFSQPLMFGDEGKENLISDLLKVDWQRIEHIIRGHKPMTDENTGDEYFIKIENHYLNDYGVNSILHFLSFYLSKDIKLGRYREDQVKLIMKQFSRQFTDWFYDNIEEFGLDTPQKKKMSKMFVHSVIDLVDSAYSHAIEGKTIELMLKQFSVMQQEPISMEGYDPSHVRNQPRKTPIMQRIFG